MNLKGIREAVRRRPFKPFTISLADGRKFSIPHPEFVAVGKRHVIIIDSEDSWSDIEPLMIVSLDYHPSLSSSDNDNSD